MIKKKIRQGSALLLAAVLGITALGVSKTYAALGVATDTRCSVQINVPSSGFSELDDLDIPVDLYKVADIAVSGAYTVTDAFKDAAITLKDAEDNDYTVELKDLNELTADQSKMAGVWEDFAAAAKKALDDGAAPGGTAIAKAAAAEIKDGTVTIGATEEEKLPVGLYLVYAQSAESDIYRYSFTPYLISLPNNYYYDEDGNPTDDDTWVYDLTGENAIGLKPLKEDLEGELIINKTVDVFNGTYDKATFVFQVEAYKKDPDNREHQAEGAKGDKVFSNVYALEFTGPGTQSVTVGKIKAGADVTVTEVYSGASYSTQQAVDTAVIIADAVLARPDNTLEKANVSFTNTHDGRPNGGSGIVNEFTYYPEEGSKGTWHYEASVDSNAEPFAASKTPTTP